MKLLFLTQTLDREDPVLGFAHDWVAALARRVERVVVAPIRRGTVDLPANVDVRPLHDALGGAAFAKAKAFARVVGGACARREIDAVFAHMVPRYAVYAAPFARPRRIPIYLWYTHKSVDWSLRLAEPLIEKAFTASDASFRLPSRKKVVTGHGIDTAKFVPPAPGEAAEDHDVVAIGRIAPAKDPETLVQAAARLRESGRPVKVLLAGDVLLAAHDAYRAALLAKIDALGLRDLVALEGAVPHPAVRATFLRAPVFASPSLTGSVDKTVLEAMACGRVPVTCNESFAEVLGDLAKELLFPPRDARALADRIGAVLDRSAAERSALAARLRAIVVEKHDLERLAARLVAEMGGTVG